MAGYRLTIAATHDVAGILLESVTRFGSEQAAKYRDGLRSTFEFLGQHPGAARIREEISPPVRAWPYKAHVVIYDADAEGGVIILRVRHQREGWLSDPLSPG